MISRPTSSPAAVFGSVSSARLAGAIDGAGIVTKSLLRAGATFGYRATTGDLGTLVLSFDADGRLHCTAGEPAHPCDLLFEGEHWAVVAALLQSPHDLDLLDRLRVDDEGSGGSWRGVLPPLDLREVRAFAELPLVRGASVIAQMVLTDSPFGLIVYSMVTEDGRVVAVDFGAAEAFDVYVKMRYEDYLRARLGLVSFAEALVHGDLNGDFGKLQMLSGLTQSPPFAQAYRHAFPAVEVLADYAQMLRESEFAAIAASLLESPERLGIAGR